MKKLLILVAEVIGAVLLFRGLNQVYAPSALIIGGLVLILIAVTVDS